MYKKYMHSNVYGSSLQAAPRVKKEKITSLMTSLFLVHFGYDHTISKIDTHQEHELSS